MMNLIKTNNNNSADNMYLYFNLDDKKYAVKINQVVEILKLPHLEYPQKLANNIVGFLNYNNLMINVLDLRFYLDIKVSGYTINNQLLIVKTDESIFGIIIDKVGDILDIDERRAEVPPVFDEAKLIDFLYREEDGDVISVINLYSIENIIKHGIKVNEVDIPSLFPVDNQSKQKFIERSTSLQDKFKYNLSKNIFSQDKFISFTLNKGSFCININWVKEFLKNIPITRVPCTPDYIEGLTTLRGNFISIINLKKFLGITDSKKNRDNSENKIIIVENNDITIGFLVDEIHNIMDIPEELISQNSIHQLNRYVLSEIVIENNLYTIFDMKNIFADEKLYIEENV